MKKILFLTAPYGYGHIKPTNVLKKEFNKLGFNTKVYDIIEEWNPTISIVTRKIYQSMYKSGLRRVYQFWYWATDQSIIGNLVIKIMKLGNRKKLKSIIYDYKPDAIICMFPSWALYKLLEKYQINVPVYTVVTDFYMHKFWFHKNLQRIFIANKWTYDNINFKISKELEDKFVISGIPIENEYEKLFNININSKQIKNSILLLAGSNGVNKEYLKLSLKIREILPNIKITLICGKNEILYKKAIKHRDENLKILGFSKNMLSEYQKVDIVITKSGGNTVSELSSLAKPAIFYNPLYGQELENAKFFSKENVAYIAINRDEVISKLIYLYKNSNKILDMRKNYLNIFTPCSCSKIIKIIKKDLV